MANNTTAENTSEKVHQSWHQVLLWTEISFTAVIAWTVFLLPEISIAVADGLNGEALLSWKTASLFRSATIAVIYTVFLLAFNVFYVFLLKPSKTRTRTILIIVPILSLLAVFLAGWYGTTVVSP